ncbi:Thioredoxin domain-containing protein [uncultured delta proteobacterium]|uniref:Thioredoxin domain-containing protein n=1 Tax=uncultured delta proteobacterium TaxID=34034 RepID=A0A212K7Z3_9DELT|nr:Thioredoxin domain-containing protein [uncultured delta proteobacterium]
MCIGKRAVFLGLLFLLIFSVATAFAATPEVPVPGTVTMVDIGADACVPCKMMAPILVKVRKEYEGRAAIIFIDVWKNPDAGRPFGISLIPTQIFYDKTGKEVGRHEGFLSEEKIKAQLDALLKQ